MDNSIKYEMLGKIFKTNYGGDCVVIEYNSSVDVVVEFLDEFKFRVRTTMAILSKGTVKNYYKRNVYGVGYTGKGKYKISENGKHFKSYNAWNGMFERSYSESYHATRPTYIGCSVHEDWHNYQEFSDFYVNNEFYGLGYHLDKDLLFEGNKVYSPDTCLLLPQEINTAIVRVKDKGNNPALGVSLSKDGKKYIARVTTKERNRHLGTYDSLEEAVEVYCKFKEEQMRCLAKKFEGRIDSRAYEKLMGWSVDRDSTSDCR